MEQKCNEIRAEILKTEKEVRALLNDPRFHAPAPTPGDYSAHKEMIANVMLAVRHLEDARMRMGKVLQAMHGGVSCYDKPKGPQ